VTAQKVPTNWQSLESKRGFPMKTEDTLDPLDRPIWGVPAMSPIISRTDAQTYYLIAKGKLDVTQMDRLYVSTPRRLLNSIGIST